MMMMNRSFTPPKILLTMYWVGPSVGLDILKKKTTIPRRPVTIPTEPFRPIFLGLSSLSQKFFQPMNTNVLVMWQTLCRCICRSVFPVPVTWTSVSHFSCLQKDRCELHLIDSPYVLRPIFLMILHNHTNCRCHSPKRRVAGLPQLYSEYAKRC